LRTGTHAQKQIVKGENLASHENFYFRLGKLEIFFFTRQERQKNAYATYVIFVIVGVDL